MPMLAQQHGFLAAAHDKPALYHENMRRGQCTITEVDIEVAMGCSIAGG